MDYAKVVEALRWYESHYGRSIPTQDEIERVMRDDVDDETRRLMQRYTSHPLQQRGEITDVAFLIGRGEWSFGEFEALMANLFASVPADRRSTARVELKGDLDDATELRVVYDRPETDEEWARAAAQSLMYARNTQADERRAYERLKQKFGEPDGGGK